MEHLLQLCDSDESLAGAMAEFLYEGQQAGDALLVCITPLRWGAVTSALRARGLDTSLIVASGQLTLRDASQLLQAIMRNGLPDPARFDQVVGGLVRDLSVPGTHVRLCGELEDVLAAAGEFRSAEILENLCNQLQEDVPFTLFCGYSAEHFGDPRSVAPLRAICRTHSLVQAGAGDPLAAFLLGKVSTPETSSGSQRRQTTSRGQASAESVP